MIKVSERFFRPAEVDLLLGDPTKAKTELGWHPEQLTGVDQLCEEMVDADMELAKMELAKIDLKKKLKVGARRRQRRLWLRAQETMHAGARPVRVAQQQLASGLCDRADAALCCCVAGALLSAHWGPVQRQACTAVARASRRARSAVFAW